MRCTKTVLIFLLLDPEELVIFFCTVEKKGHALFYAFISRITAYIWTVPNVEASS